MKEYIAKKVGSRMSVNDSRWDNVPEMKLDYVWQEHYPSPYKTTAQLVHSDSGITVRMTTNEWPLTITAMRLNESVCIDSCMEFFFTPNLVDENYINLEMNPVGTALVGFGPGRGSRCRLDIKSGGCVIETLIKPEEGWTLIAYIPYSFLNEHFSCCDKKIKANFYKCGDRTVAKHYSAWNAVETPEPDYHRPEYFAEITLSEEEI